MGNLLSCKNVSFAYRGSKQLALDKVDFSIDEGEFVGIAGATGAGKSTLVRCASGIVPKFFKGPFSGEVLVKGKPIRKRRVAELAGTIGTVFQDFESQLFSTNVRRELAFGMENLCIERETMLSRIDQVAKLVGLSDFTNREPQSLSGGQKQRLALASILCLNPDLLLCDEPTTDLDPIGKKDLLDILEHLVASGNSVGLVEHDTERLIHADRIIIMHDGCIVASGKPTDILSDPRFCIHNGLFAPQMLALFSLLGLQEQPFSIEEAKEILDRKGFITKAGSTGVEMPEPGGAPLINIEDVHFSYTPNVPVLHGVSLEIRQGEFVCILGKNGSGKTTLVMHFNAFLQPTSGHVLFNGTPVNEIGPAKIGRRIGFVFQNPDQMLFAANVFEEVTFGLRNYGVAQKAIPQKVSTALEAVGLAGKEEVDPFIMTKGERQKLAVACVLACEPEVIMLDEPTTGLDAEEQVAMMELLTTLNRAGHTIVIITHSVQVAAAYAHRVVLLDSGKIIGEGTAREIFSRPDLLSRTGLIAPPCVRLGNMYGLSVLTVSEMAESIERKVP
jgi:energy-coupling factor transporter ATP-binding protein EcfA2